MWLQQIKVKRVLIEDSELEVTSSERHSALVKGSTSVVENSAYGSEVQLPKSLTHVVLKTLEELKQESEAMKRILDKKEKTNSTITILMSTSISRFPPQP